jgi:hypothetical protein
MQDCLAAGAVQLEYDPLADGAARPRRAVDIAGRIQR